MTDAVESGLPFPSDVAGPIDEWSEAVYAALHTWDIARDGEWTRWEPGYLLLTIKRVDGREIEPVVLYTADEELTVSFGYWVTHDPAPYELWDAEADVIAEYAKLLVTQWLNGEIRTAVVTDANGTWCRTTTIAQGALGPQLAAAARWRRGGIAAASGLALPRNALGLTSPALAGKGALSARCGCNPQSLL